MMKKIIATLIFLIAITTFCHFAEAQVVSTNSTGMEKNNFYANESVYFMTTQNITSNMTSVRVYVVTDSNSWSEGASLSSSVLSNLFQTNNSGYINNTLLWQIPTIGKYDIVVDRDNDGFYNSSYDFVDSLTATGFEVTALPVGSLAASIGPNSTTNHNWDVAVNGSGNNIILQLKLATGSYEGVSLRSVALVANGSGDDRNDISAVMLTVDSNSDGKYSSDEYLLAMSKFLKDDGTTTLTVTDGYTIPANTTAYLLVVYAMSTSAQSASTFGCSVSSASVLGLVSNSWITASGLPVDCSITTISGAVTTSSSSTTSSVATSSSTSSTSTTSTTSTTTIPMGTIIMDNIVYIIIAIIAIAVPIVAIFFFKRRMKSDDIEYGKLREKWKTHY